MADHYVVVATSLLLLLLSLLLFLIPLIDAVNRRSRSITDAACNIVKNVGYL